MGMWLILGLGPRTARENLCGLSSMRSILIGRLRHGIGISGVLSAGRRGLGKGGYARCGGVDRARGGGRTHFSFLVILLVTCRRVGDLLIIPISTTLFALGGVCHIRVNYRKDARLSTAL
jgi:hypothetical protein